MGMLMAPPPPTPITGVVRERLTHLYATVHAPGSRTYTNAEVARGVAELGGRVSEVYLKKLRGARSGTPSLRVLDELAAFFGVPVSYFLDPDPAPIDGVRLDIRIRLRSRALQEMLTAARRLPDAAQAVLPDIVTGLLRAEGRDPIRLQDLADAADLDSLDVVIADAGRLSPASQQALRDIIAKLGLGQGRHAHPGQPRRPGRRS